MSLVYIYILFSQIIVFKVILMNSICDISFFVMNFEHFVRHFLTPENYELLKITFTIYQNTSVKI